MLFGLPIATICFTDKALETALEQCLAAETPMVYPQTLQIHRQHELGDALIRRVQKDTAILQEVDLGEFTQRRNTRAIGGIQIVRGNYCRGKRLTFPDHRKWQKEAGACGWLFTMPAATLPSAEQLVLARRSISPWGLPGTAQPVW